jgi:beta-glucosidase
VDRPIAQASSYNLINGTFSCENDYTMNTILKGELNFQGLYVDYGATHSTIPTAMSGMDMELPSVAYCE